MINQFEVPSLIAGKLPQVKSELCRQGAALSAYQSIQVLTDYTKRMALEHNFTMVKKCMEVVNNLYGKGNRLVRNAVENVFVFSFSTMMTGCNIVEWRIVQSYMPSELYTLFVQQVLKSKC